MNYDITTLIVFSVALLNVTVNLVCGVLVYMTARVFFLTVALAKLMMMAVMLMAAVCASAQSDKEPVNAYFTTVEMKAYKKAVAKRAKSKK